MNRKTRMTLLGLIFGLACLPALAHAKPKRGQGMLNPKRIERMAEKIGVSEGVRKEMKSLVFDAKRRSIPLKAKAQEAQLDLQELMDADTPDVASVMDKIEAIGKIQIEVRKLRVGTMLKVRALLTPEQRTQLAEMMARRKGKKGRRGPRGQHRRPSSELD